jgi:hypothetical protein
MNFAKFLKGTLFAGFLVASLVAQPLVAQAADRGGGGGDIIVFDIVDAADNPINDLGAAEEETVLRLMPIYMDYNDGAVKGDVTASGNSADNTINDLAADTKESAAAYIRFDGIDGESTSAAGTDNTINDLTADTKELEAVVEYFLKLDGVKGESK